MEPLLAKKPNGEAGCCEHCSGLVYDNTIKCPQCGKFPVRIHRCPRCRSLSSPDAAKCWKCGRVFLADNDFL